MVANYTQTLETQVPAEPAKTDKPNLMGLVNSLDDETLRRILGGHSQMINGETLQSVQKKQEDTPMRAELIVIS